MVRRFEERLNQVFAAHDEIREAELLNDSRLAGERLRSALSVSCILLRDIRRDGAFATLTPTADDAITLQRLRTAGTLGAFLAVERRLLIRAKLEAEFVDPLISALRKVVAQPEQPPDDWRETFSEFTEAVCRSAQVLATDAKAKPLLTRAMFAVGGAFITFTNNAALAKGALDPVAATWSVLGGSRVLWAAVDDQVKGWWKR